MDIQTRSSTTEIKHNRWQSSPDFKVPSEFLTSLPLDDDYVELPSNAENIRAIVRIKPNLDHEQFCLDVDGSSITITSQFKTAFDKKSFVLDGVLSETARQEDVYDVVGLPLVENVLDGYNGTIFAYGQTGSGKTHTMQGDISSSERGVIPRIMEHLFRQLQQRQVVFTCTCSFLEIYNEKIFDLLDDRTTEPKLLREDAFQGVFVQDLLEIPVRRPEDALEQLATGSKNRTVGSTAMNRESSRSHSVYTIKLIQRVKDDDIEVTRKSTLHLVDLAGSEKQSHTGAVGTRLKEASQINKSLSALGKVITGLVDVSNGLKRYIHYRDSKLTFLLRDALGGNSKTTVVATVSPLDKWFSETLSTLQFVQRVKCIKNNAKKYEDDTIVIARLEKRVRELELQVQTSKTSNDGLKILGEVEIQVLQQKADELSTMKLMNEKLELVVKLLNDKVTSSQEELHATLQELSATKLAFAQATTECESLRVKQTLMEIKLNGQGKGDVAPVEISASSTDGETIKKLQDIVAELHSQLIAAENARALSEKRLKEATTSKSFSLFKDFIRRRKARKANKTGRKWWQRFKRNKPSSCD